jgi:DNA-binding NarL/FixJ family response regulator
MVTKNHSTSSRQPRRVLILDDHPMTRYGIARLLEQEPDLSCCGEAGTAQEALALLERGKPHLILVDLTLSQSHGLEFIKDLRALHPQTLALVVSMHDELLYAERALRAGARGYIMKSEGGAKLVQAIRQVLDGKIYVSENISGRMLDVFSGRRRATSITGKLTDREFEVFCLLGQGLTTGEIGKQLRLSVKTVETHRIHLRNKLHIKTGAALIKYAMRWADSKGMV